MDKRRVFPTPVHKLHEYRERCFAKTASIGLSQSVANLTFSTQSIRRTGTSVGMKMYLA